jgi:hypothetical protein
MDWRAFRFVLLLAADFATEPESVCRPSVLALSSDDSSDVRAT